MQWFQRKPHLLFMFCCLCSKIDFEFKPSNSKIFLSIIIYVAHVRTILPSSRVVNTVHGRYERDLFWTTWASHFDHGMTIHKAATTTTITIVRSYHPQTASNYHEFKLITNYMHFLFVPQRHCMIYLGPTAAVISTTCATCR
jgi:hypothetical protein